jgi:hypothetical protein
MRGKSQEIILALMRDGYVIWKNPEMETYRINLFHPEHGFDKVGPKEQGCSLQKIQQATLDNLLETGLVVEDVRKRRGGHQEYILSSQEQKASLTESNVYNTLGAAKYLGCTIDNIHGRVRNGHLRAHKYDENGVLVEWKEGDKHRGQGLYFLQSDLDEYKRTKKRGRPFSKQKSA